MSTYHEARYRFGSLNIEVVRKAQRDVFSPPVKNSGEPSSTSKVNPLELAFTSSFPSIVSDAHPPILQDFDTILTDEQTSTAVDEADKQAWRLMTPFLMLVSLVLLLLFYMLRGPAAAAPLADTETRGGAAVRESVGPVDGRGPACAPQEHQAAYEIRDGDSCWAVAQRHGMSLEGLRGMNEGLECERLMAGKWICVRVGQGDEE